MPLLKGAADVGCVAKPPVGIVANACARAWYGVISSSMPNTHSDESISTWIAVSAT